MAKRVGQKIRMTSIDELLGVPTITGCDEIEVARILPFKDHPFKVLDDDKMHDFVESIMMNGILVPVTVRPLEDGDYEMLSGHRRLFAVNQINLEKIQAIVKEYDDDKAVLAVVDSNLQREEILPSEKAFAYKMKLEALTHQGKRTDLTSAQLGEKLESKYSVQLLAEEVGDSRSQIQRFIRLTALIPELLDLVDEKQIALSPAVELSFLKDEEQYAVLDCIECNVATPSHAQAIRLKKMSQEGTLTTDEIEDILSEEKPNQIPKMKFNADRIRNVLPKNIEEKKIEDFVVNAIEFYGKHLQRQKSMNAR